MWMCSGINLKVSFPTYVVMLQFVPSASEQEEEREGAVQLSDRQTQRREEKAGRPRRAGHRQAEERQGVLVPLQ